MTGAADPVLEQVTSGQLEHALSALEALLARIEHARLAARSAITVLAATVVIGSGAIAAIMYKPAELTTTSVIAALTIAAATVAVLAGYGSRVLVLRRQVARDEDAVFSSINVIREAVPLVSENEGWDATQEHLIATRLGRFPIDRPRRRR